MYVPERFSPDNEEVLNRIIDEGSFGTLISVREGEPVLTHLPFLREGKRLIAHMAKANTHWKVFADNPRVLVEILGPHAYISPAWYPPSPSNVPTWNYVAVHVRGSVQIVHDAETKWNIVAKLIERHEAEYGTDWKVDREGAEKQLAGIVAFEIAIERLEGNLKLGQHQPAAVRANVIHALGQWMARVTTTP